MDLNVLLEPVAQDRAPGPCKVARIVASLEEPYRSALDRLVSTKYQDGGLADEALAARMKAAGVPAGATVINRHRRGQCTCEGLVVG